MVNVVSGIDLARLPVNEEEHNFGAWHIKYKSSHILHSKCIETDCSKDDSSKCCIFCKFNQELALPHLPDMVFANNILSLNYKNSGRIEFNAMDALKKVQNGKMNLKIACSQEWKEARLSTGLTEKEILPFDWTFTTDYQGTLIGDWLIEDCNEEQIDYERLKQKDRILFFNELTLFEDELHDNGIAQLSVKVRVMEWGFFVLLRFFLRIDNVLIRAFDTRLYHEFDKDFVIREINAREAKICELKDPSVSIKHQAEVVPLIPLRASKNEKLQLKSTVE